MLNNLAEEKEKGLKMRRNKIVGLHAGAACDFLISILETLFAEDEEEKTLGKSRQTKWEKRPTSTFQETDEPTAPTHVVLCGNE